jgi:hypothetical protein
MANFFDRFNPFFKGFQIGSYGFDEEEVLPKVPVQPREAQFMTRNSIKHSIQLSHTERLAQKHGLSVDEFIALKTESVETQVKTDNVLQLFPSWPDDRRCASNEILRSSLFAVVKKGDRAPLQDVKIGAWGDDEVYFTGVQLDQYDLDVWLQLLHLYRKAQMGSKVYFTLREFLKALGKSVSGQNAKALKLSFARLQAGGVRLRSISAKRSYQGSLLEKVFEDEESGKWCVIINPDFLPLFTHATTWLNWEIRKSLSSPLSKWLQGWVCSHKAQADAPQKISLENIQKLSGCHYDRKDNLKRDVVKALNEIQKKATIESFEFEKGILSVVRLPKMLQP